MNRQTKKIDYLRDPPAQIFWAVATPLFIVQFVQLAINILTNKLYSAFADPVIFAVLGYLGPMVELFFAISTGVVSAAWIKIARYFSGGNPEQIREHIVNAVLSICIMALSIMGILLLCTDPVLRAVNVTEEIYPQAKLYYMVYIGTFLPVPLASFCLMVLNGTSNTKTIFLVNLATVLLTMVITVVTVTATHGSIVAAAMLGCLYALAQITLYLVLLKRKNLVPGIRSYFMGLRKRRPYISGIIRYGLIISLQSTLCTVGHWFVGVQSNRYLSMTYISVVGVMITIFNAMAAISSAITIFCPQNYGAYRYDRVKRYFRIAVITAVSYGFLCLGFYILGADLYHGMLWEDPERLAYGRELWLMLGLGSPFIAVIYTFRFLLDAVGYNKLSLLSGVGELTGALISAFWLIPAYGHIGRSVSLSLGWVLASVFLVIIYLAKRKKIFAKQPPEVSQYTAEK